MILLCKWLAPLLSLICYVHRKKEIRFSIASHSLRRGQSSCRQPWLLAISQGILSRLGSGILRKIWTRKFVAGWMHRETQLWSVPQVTPLPHLPAHSPTKPSQPQGGQLAWYYGVVPRTRALSNYTSG